MNQFERELTDLINKHSMEGASDTPDFVLSHYLQKCLDAFNIASRERESWHGREVSVPARNTLAKLED